MTFEHGKERFYPKLRRKKGYLITDTRIIVVKAFNKLINSSKCST